MDDLFCETCGKKVSILMKIDFKNHKVQCFDCMAKDMQEDKKEEIKNMDIYICENCLREKDRKIEFPVKAEDNKLICESCRVNFYDKCSECGNYVHKDNYEIIDGKILCKHCQEINTRYCEDCGEIHLEDNCYCVCGGVYVCSDCYNDHYFCCDRCGEDLNTANIAYVEEDVTICRDCYEEEANKSIHSYDYKPYETIFYNHENEDENNLHVGIELEIQGKGYIDFIKEKKDMFNEDIFYLKHDGSLNSYGVEIVSMPMTYNYIMNNTHWYKLFKLMEKHNMDDIDDCGLHFHLDKKYFTDYQISVIDYIVNNFSKYFEAEGGRQFNSNSRYCKKVNKNKDYWGKHTLNESRYQAVNLTNKNTIELRFCESTKDFETFIERVKLIFAIAEFAKTHNLDDIYWWNDNTFEKNFNNLFTKYFNQED